MANNIPEGILRQATSCDRYAGGQNDEEGMESAE
jgi:hypothetical protein